MEMPSQDDLYLFYQGEQMNAHAFLGCHADGEGFCFAVWAPNAVAVSVVGDFNVWDIEHTPMWRMDDEIFYARVPRLGANEPYKYAIRAQDGLLTYKQDPYALRQELRPNTCSLTYAGSRFEFTDETYLKIRSEKNFFKSPISIYEVHLPSWRESGAPFTFKRAIDELIPYVKDMGFTHIELMPIAEHPLDASWGYQVTGFCAVTGRLGLPEDFAAFVDACHAQGIGVILDFVMGHFPKDGFALYRYDGMALYEHEDVRKGEHKEWGTCIFNYGRGAVRSFLLSCANYYLTNFHVDGLRLDAVSSMLYLNYCKEDGEWVANEYGGRENLEAIEFIKFFNKSLLIQHPNVQMFAEEATTYPMVTQPPAAGGLGFNFKWNMGWMNDMLYYMSLDPLFRKQHHDKITFSLTYAFSENYVLPLSHDEVVHGKYSLLSKMSGYYDDKFAQLRAFYAFMWTHPGKKLLFMGGEFGQFIEWRYYQELDWLLLQYDKHAALLNFVKMLNLVYIQNRALYERDDGWDGFEWSVVQDANSSVIAYIRTGVVNRRVQRVLCVFNFTPVWRGNYHVGVPYEGEYALLLNSDDARYGGADTQVPARVETQKGEMMGFKQYLSLTLPPHGALLYAIEQMVSG